MSARQTGDAIEVFADIVCPFTHVGLQRLFALRDELGRRDVAIRVRAWPLELVNGELVDGDLLDEEIQELRASVAPDMFRGFDPGVFPMSSLPALAVAARAYRHDPRLGEDVSLALREALFERGSDLGDPETLGALAETHGVPEPEAEDRAAVLADHQEGCRRGVVGSPHFLAGDSAFFCPTLSIERVEGRLTISFDEDGFKRVVETFFRAE